MSKRAKSITEVTTGNVTFNHPSLFRPQAFAAGQVEKYGLQILIDKTDSSTINKINEAIGAAKNEGMAMWGGVIPKNLKLPLRDGDKESEEIEYYAGHYFLNCASKFRPAVINKEGSSITSEVEIYSGCRGRVCIKLFPYKAPDNSCGIGCRLLSALKLEEGEMLWRRDPMEDFEDCDEEELL